MKSNLQRQALSRQKTAAKHTSVLEEQLAALLREYPEAPAEAIEPDPVKWLEANRFLKDGSPYSFDTLPFLREIARDKTKNVYVAKGRQLGMTTLSVGLLIHFAVLNPGTHSMYITLNRDRATSFSKQKLKAHTINVSPKMAGLIDQDEDLVQNKTFKNGSILRFASGQDDFNAARSHDLDYLIIDEAQGQNMLTLPNAKESMSMSKHGRLLCIGTGQVEGGSWEKTFHTGEERRYNTKTKKWSKLQGTNTNKDVHSYYLPQSHTGLFTQKQIEAKLSTYISRTIGMQEIECDWTAGGEKPFSESVMQSCIIPDAVHTEGMQQVLGIDYGGGRSKTCLILMHETDGTYYIDDARIVETSNVDAQAREIIRYIERVKPVHIVQDVGGGIHQCQTLEGKYRNITKGHLMANLTNPFDHDRRERLVNMDKTACIDQLIDIAEAGRLKIPKKLDWICKHFSNVQSKLASMAGGQAYTKYYCEKGIANDDACMATVFAIAAYKIRNTGRGRVLGVFGF